MLHLKLTDLISDVDSDNILPFKSFTFNGGEQHIEIDQDFCPALTHMHSFEVLVEISLTDSAKVMLVLLATDALKRLGFKYISLFAPYLPYARQDRVCNPGESLSIKVICDLVNAQGYNTVYTLDNHSDVSTALLNNHKAIDIAAIINRKYTFRDWAIVSPDAGALKKTLKLAKELGNLQVIECSKKRNVANGEIIGVQIHELKAKLTTLSKFVIIDDICDGGRTFTELAKEIRVWNSSCKINLFVSHGIFSKGLSVFDGLIDDVFTTKSFKNDITDKIGVGFEQDDL